MRIQYCQCCKINHEQGKGHIYSRKHVKKLQEWSERQKKRVDDCILIAQQGYANTYVSNHSFWCAFCSIEILDEAPMIVYFSISLTILGKTVWIIFVQKSILIESMNSFEIMEQITS